MSAESEQEYTSETFEKIADALVEALGADRDEVVPGALIVGNLGAESVDFLEIAYRIEKSCGIRFTLPDDLSFQVRQMKLPEPGPQGNLGYQTVADLARHVQTKINEQCPPKNS